MVTRTLRLTAPPHTVDTVHDLLDSVWESVPDLSARDRMSLETAIIELTANVIQHANHGRGVQATLTVIAYEDRLEATLSDSGEVDHVDLEGREMPEAESLAESGRGVPLMKALVDTVEHRRVDGFNHWTLVRGREAQDVDRSSTRGMPSVSITGVIDEMARQRALEELGILDTSPEERFDRVTRLAKSLFGVQSAAINLIDGDRQWAKSIAGDAVVEMPRESSVCTDTIMGDDTLVVPELTADPAYAVRAQDGLINFYAGHPLYASTGERIGAFCIYDPHPRAFSEREQAMLRDLASWVQQELSVSQELSRAAEVQQGLLPSKMLSMPGWDIAGFCQPARAVGGDFYDWYPVGEGAAITLADTMGKGIAAAIIAATVRAVLRSAARFGDVTGAVNLAAASLNADLDTTGLFVTLFHARVDMDSGEVTFVDAGHGLTVIARTDGTIERLRSHSPPLGVDIDTEWEEQTITLEPGDTLVAASDGVLDLYDGSLDGLDRVAALALLASSSQEVVDALRTRARGTSSDDVTVVVVRRDD
ncbi:SpoIIE family protein phosphatase [Microcella indica]|uniref:SpoIIE family protein phosphatase n=1 Tax=Microcella indica TaxID=2750620 RepID=UPI0015CF7DFF|nr:SpoIIE family protein phosphatase [Microcella indica]